MDKVLEFEVISVNKFVEKENVSVNQVVETDENGRNIGRQNSMTIEIKSDDGLFGELNPGDKVTVTIAK